MAKRTIQICDLTKQEYDPDLTVKITFLKNGKKTGRTYELSPEAAERLEQQLVGNHPLPTTWTFSIRESMQQAVKTPTQPQVTQDEEDEMDAINEKRRQIVRRDEEPEMQTDVDQQTCSHMNKGPVVMTMRGEQRVAYRACKACGKHIFEKTRNDQKSYASEKLPSDVRMKDYEKS